MSKSENSPESNRSGDVRAGLGEMTPANIRISKRIAGVKSETIES